MFVWSGTLPRSCLEPFGRCVVLLTLSRGPVLPEPGFESRSLLAPSLTHHCDPPPPPLGCFCGGRMSCGTMPCICSNCGVELGKAAAVCSAGETRVCGCFVHPKGKGSLFLQDGYAPSHQSSLCQPHFCLVRHLICTGS